MVGANEVTASQVKQVIAPSEGALESTRFPTLPTSSLMANVAFESNIHETLCAERSPSWDGGDLGNGGGGCIDLPGYQAG